ncbi:RNase J family beta-CASP ribonuclease [Brotaphodocola sp.]|uniref:ribonuclease J n=1 Tax=Brotaphodocola sp. TaxID=3073577 RepID=UPI003D7D540F
MTEKQNTENQNAEVYAAPATEREEKSVQPAERQPIEKPADVQAAKQIEQDVQVREEKTAEAKAEEKAEKKTDEKPEGANRPAQKKGRGGARRDGNRPQRQDRQEEKKRDDKNPDERKRENKTQGENRPKKNGKPKQQHEAEKHEAGKSSPKQGAKQERAEKPEKKIERQDRNDRSDRPEKPEKTAAQRTKAPKRAERQNAKLPAVAAPEEVGFVPGTGEGQAKVRIIPLGGLEQIGMNITAFEYEDTIVVVDCGLAFPTDDMLGIDLVIPDVTYLERNIDKVKGFVITHGHEDHIGALPYILQKINVPVYGTKLTIALIENKLKEHNLMKNTKRKVVKHGQSITLGAFRVEFIKTNHSIADAAALALFTPAGVIVHTGDFKVDYTPVFGDAFDLPRFAELGKKGVLALLSDSTNAIRPGFTASERTVGKTFDAVFAEHKNNRIIVATFASNVDRVQQIVYSACKYGRKVVVEGRSMVNVIGTASELGYINIPENTLIDIDQLKNYPDEQTVLITTGSQGEAMAALSRMASGMHRKVTIKPNDVVIMSSHPIPGNEKAVSKVINELAMKGVEVITEDTHVSGHACQEEIKLIYSLLHPRYALPVHGEYRHLVANRSIAMAMGVPKERTLIMSSGNVVEICEDYCKVVDQVQAGGILVDGLGVGDVGNIVLRDRQNLAQNGIIIVVLTLEKYSNQLLAGPDIVSRGFVYVRESEDLMDDAKNIVDNAVADCLDRHVTDWGKIKNIIRDSLSDFLWKRMKRSPMILPIIMEVE